MTFQQYLDGALTTAIYPQQPSGAYTNLGLREEVGEVSGKFKKLMRDDGWLPGQLIPENKRLAIALELGDCAWYIINIMHEDNLTFHYSEEADSNQSIVEASFERGIFYNLDGLFNECYQITHRNHRNQVRLCCTWAFTHIAAIAMFLGYTLSDIFELNLDKLASRQQRNTLHGSGDNR